MTRVQKFGLAALLIGVGLTFEGGALYFFYLTVNNFLDIFR